MVAKTIEDIHASGFARIDLLFGTPSRSGAPPLGKRLRNHWNLPRGCAVYAIVFSEVITLSETEYDERPIARLDPDW
jgi:hypothetical protein